MEIYHQGNKVDAHEKTPVDEWKLDIMHYIATFEYKPGSVAGSAALRFSVPELREAYLSDFADNPSGFISLLKKTRDRDLTLEDFICAYAMLSDAGISHVTVAAMEQMLFHDVPLKQDPVTIGVKVSDIEKHARHTLSQIMLKN